MILPEQRKFGLHFTRDPKKNYPTVGRKGVPFSRSELQSPKTEVVQKWA